MYILESATVATYSLNNNTNNSNKTSKVL